MAARAITVRFAPNEGNEIQVLRRLLIFESAGVCLASPLTTRTLHICTRSFSFYNNLCAGVEERELLFAFQASCVQTLLELFGE
jgi:hypothetical protein